MQVKQPNRVQRAIRMVFHVRRRLATCLAVVLTLVFGYHAFFGQNGITAYAEKRNVDRVLAAEIQRLANENARLQQHVDRLQSDPDAIEHEARERLHYTRPGEVIYTLDDHPQPDANRPDQLRPRGTAAAGVAMHPPSSSAAK